jgi:hypothetical protein
MIETRSCLSDPVRLSRFSYGIQGRSRPGFGMIGRFLGVASGGNGSDQRSPAYQNSDAADYPSRQCGPRCRIRRLPLGAKVGFSMILALGAWFCGYVGFGRFLERRINAFQGFGYLALSLALFMAGILPFWWAGG